MSNFPQTQKAWTVVRMGKPAQAVELRDTEVSSKLKAGEVLVKVQAAAFNPICYKLMGLLPNVVANRPFVAEHDLTGIIVDANGTQFKNGDAVFGFSPVDIPRNKTNQGALQQYARLPAAHLAIRPPNVTATQAAGISMTAQTAYQGLFEVGGLQDGQRLFVNGGSTTVGAFAIQMAKARGCYVLATASAKNEEYVRGLGADEFIDYTAAPLHEFLSANPPAEKYHVLFDAAGLTETSLYVHSPDYIVPGGVYVSTGPSINSAGDFVDIASKVFLRPGCNEGSKRKWKMINVRNKPEDLETIRALVAEGKLKPLVDSVYSFEDVQQAYERLMTHRARGKVVVKVDAGVE